MDALGGLFAAGLASYLVFYRTSVDASDTGFSLNMAVAFSGGIIWVSNQQTTSIFTNLGIVGPHSQRVRSPGKQPRAYTRLCQNRTGT
jgi:hypothetical protein